MDGNCLKWKLKSEGENLSELATKLGYSSKQAFHSILSSKDIKTSVIESLSKIMDRPVSWFYGENNQTTLSQNVSRVINSNIDQRQYYSDSPDILRAQIDMMDERIKEKDAQIKEKDAQIKTLLEILKK